AAHGEPGEQPMTGREVKRENGPDFEPADFFALRTPLLPFDELLAFGEGLTSACAGPAHLEAALAEDRVLLRARLRAVVARPDVAREPTLPPELQPLPRRGPAPLRAGAPRPERALVPPRRGRTDRLPPGHARACRARRSPVGARSGACRGRHLRPRGGGICP